ncbi:MAG: enoyl-CoA hydratase/isomerase family protein [Rhodospirillales bacterium]|nr:enoyl-CoA hydratase/isomerase family protein [Rhodospirillales bacterium]
MSSNITVKDADGACWITISRENKANALLPDDCDAIRRHVEDAVAKASTKAIVFTGAGHRAFSAGMDVTAFLDLTASTARAYIEPLKDMLNTVRMAPVPTIAGINGGCIGAGIELAAACDIRIAVNTAVFGLPEIKVGIPAALDAALLQQYIGLSKAKEMMILGDLYSAKEMDDCGLLNQVVEPGDLQDALNKVVAKVQPFTRTVTTSQKRMFETWQNFGIKDANETSVDLWAAVFTEDETMETIAEYKKTKLSKKSS